MTQQAADTVAVGDVVSNESDASTTTDKIKNAPTVQTPAPPAPPAPPASASVAAVSFDSINAELDALEPDDRATLLNKCETLKTFLDATVLPYLAQGMIKIAREAPEDPILFLSEYLRDMSEKVAREAGDEARKEFYSQLAEAEGRNYEDYVTN